MNGEKTSQHQRSMHSLERSVSFFERSTHSNLAKSVLGRHTRLMPFVKHVCVCKLEQKKIEKLSRTKWAKELFFAFVFSSLTQMCIRRKIRRKVRVKKRRERKKKRKANLTQRSKVKKKNVFMHKAKVGKRQRTGERKRLRVGATKNRTDSQDSF